MTVQTLNSRVRQLSIDKISPYIRYVNEIYYDHEETFVDRIIYDHEFIFPMSGEATIYINHQKHILRRGTVAYIRPNEQNQMIMEAGKTFHAHCIHFDWLLENEEENFNAETFYMKMNFSPEEKKIISKLIRRPLYEINDNNFPPIITGVDADILEPLFKKMYYLFIEHNCSSMLRMKSAFFSIVAELLDRNSSAARGKTNLYYANLIAKIAETLRNEYSSDWSISDFSKDSGISSKYLGTLFKEIYHTSFKEYLIDVRMQNAKRMLTTTDLSISEIASSVGINDAYYFSKLFKKNEQLSPSKYRRMLKE